MEQKYYLSIDSNNLGHYFSAAIIAPQKYYKEPIDDFQSLNKEFLIFTTKKITKKSDCCIEIILTEKENELLIKNSSKTCALLNNALPITRISSIFFHSKEKMENNIDLARSSSFIPERLIKIADKNDLFNEDINDFIKNKRFKDLSSLINYYDRYIGGFAFMKISGEDYMNYSHNYFSTLSFFNEAIKSDTESAENKISLQFDKRYQGIFNKKDNNWERWRNLIFAYPKEIVSEIRQKVPYKNGLFRQEEVENKKELYILSVLANYGHEQIKPKKVEALLFDIISQKIKYKEIIALFFGINTGYKKLKKSYDVSNQNIPIKFELGSKLDYYTLESIYQFVFNNTISSQFAYIDELINKNTKKAIDKKKFYTYQILDENIVFKKKATTIKEVIYNFFKEKMLPNILNLSVLDFSKKYGIEFTDSQKKTLNKKFMLLIQKPIYKLVDELVSEVIIFNGQEKNFDKESNYSFKEPQSSVINEQKIIYSILKKEIDIHKYYLSKLSVSEVGKIAKKKNIINSKFKVSSNNKNEIIQKIIDTIQNEQEILK